MAFTLFLGFDQPSLDYPVGLDARNVRDDVMLVQVWLGNCKIWANEGAAGPLALFGKQTASVDMAQFKVDGKFGHQTRLMLSAFAHTVAIGQDRFGRGWAMPLELTGGGGISLRNIAFRLSHESSSACSAQGRTGGQLGAGVQCMFSSAPLVRVALANRRKKPADRWQGPLIDI